MKIFTLTIGACILFGIIPAPTLGISLDNYASAFGSMIDSFSPFDSYGNICLEDEKARLDNLAIYLQKEPDRLGYIIVYAGHTSCAGEVQARAGRAKKWVVESRGI